MHKRILAVHDISCIGRCSLTVALPILSAAGIETSVLPTAVLSTHTGNFDGYTFRDLTDDILPICNHWKNLGITFESIFTGYLGSFEQIELVKNIIEQFSREDSLIMVDPVMGDNGRLYSKLTNNFPEGFRELCKKAQVITPNLTEASMLLDMPYCSEGYNEDYIKKLLKGLAELGPEKVVLTGISFSESQLGCGVFDKKTNTTDFVYEEKVDGFFHGTGDIFSSALLASLMNGLPLSASAAAAVGFTAGAIRRTKRSGSETRYGVDFEAGLAEFGLKIKAKK